MLLPGSSLTKAWVSLVWSRYALPSLGSLWHLPVWSEVWSEVTKYCDFYAFCRRSLQWWPSMPLWWRAWHTWQQGWWTDRAFQTVLWRQPWSRYHLLCRLCSGETFMKLLTVCVPHLRYRCSARREAGFVWARLFRCSEVWVIPRTIPLSASSGTAASCPSLRYSYISV